MANQSGCGCQNKKKKKGSLPPLSLPVKLTLGILFLGAWFAVYSKLLPLSHFITYDLLGIGQGSRQGAAIQFFLYDTPKILLLLTLVVFAVGILRSFFTPERSRKILAQRHPLVGHGLGAVIGIVTPFCSCSAVPLFIGFMNAGVPLGITFSYLIAAPMINEVALILLWGMFGWKVALLYVATGLTVALVAGWIMGRLQLEHLVEEWVTTSGSSATPLTIKPDWNQRIDLGLAAVREIVGKVWLYMVAGIGVGALIHGYVPQGTMAAVMGKGAWWSVPAAVIMGIPMYANAAGIVPVVHALMGKGAALGTALAFMMSVIALSLPEMMILRKVLKPQLIAIFVGVVGSGILLVGYLFNLLI
ncbi:MAG: permease [Thermodesulfobacteriota bacterium]